MNVTGQGIRTKLAITALALAASSCVAVVAGAAAGVGYVQYERNEVARDFEEPYGEVWGATRQALEELGYVAVETTPDDDRTRGQLEGPDLNIRVERRPEGIVRVRVRIGTFLTEDHRRQAELVLEAIAKRL